MNDLAAMAAQEWARNNTDAEPDPDKFGKCVARAYDACAQELCDLENARWEAIRLKNAAADKARREAAALAPKTPFVEPRPWWKFWG